jgi:hypothetical protein
VVVPEKFNPYRFKGEWEMFQYIWDTRVHKCFVTGESLDRYEGTDLFPNLFAHILRKSLYKEFRLNINNISLVKPEVHHHFDNATLDSILKFEAQHKCSFRGLFELETILYNEYKKEFGTTTIKRKIIERYEGVKKDTFN